MNSREKQRKAMHANRSVIARIHQLPLYMKVINVILAIVLALGVGSNWAYAAELIPEPTNTTETMTMAYDENPVVYAPEAAGASTYEWQVYLADRDIYAPIGGESKSSLTLSSSLLDNESVLSANREATVRCVVFDSEGNELNTKTYVVALGEAPKIDQTLAASALQSAKVEAETVSFNDASTDAQGELSAEENKTFTIKIRFYASRVSEETYLGYELKSDFEVTSEKGFDWLVRVNSELGKVASLIVPTEFQSVVIASKTSAIGFDDAIYIQGMKELASMSQTECTISAIYDVNAFKYTVHAWYQDLDNPSWYNEKIVVREASLNMPVPTTPAQYSGSVDDETFFKDGGTNGEMGKGWKIVEFHGDTVRNVDQGLDQPGVQVTMYLDHEYSVLDFNLLGNLESKGEDPGNNGPIAVYMRNGEDFNTIASWKQGNAYLPTPTPVKSAYVFDHWYYIDGMTQRDMPKDTWEGQKAPGVQRTYYAYWNLETKITEAKVTIAYWGQTVDSPYDNPKYEYLIERYANVSADNIGTTYSLPVTPGTSDPMNDRRYPQVRVSGQEVQCTSTIEYVDGSGDIYSSSGYRYNVLYEYSGYQTAVVKADGSTTIKVWLKRSQRYIRFSYTPVGQTRTTTVDLSANWDADISDRYNEICQDAKGYNWSTWTSSKTNNPTSVLINMPKYLYSTTTTDGRADTWTESTREPNGRHAGYYIHKVDATSTGHPTGSNLFNAQPDGTQYAQYWDTKAYVEVTFRITANDDYVAILGFQTPAAGGGHAVRNNTTWPEDACACFYYFRNEKGLYLRNIHGVTDCPTSGQYANMPYHQDQCVSVGQHYDTNSKATSTDDPVRYEKLAGNLAFPGTERSEFVVNQWATGTGESGITAGTLLKDFIPIVPNTEDQHFIFEGWYTDPNYDAAAKVDFDTWKMPNHEQDLFAHWVAPKCKLEFKTKDPSSGDPEIVEGGIQDCTYDEYPSEEGVNIPTIPEKQGYKFIAWYYYQTEADAKAGTNKVWFNPETMTMPFVDWGEESDPSNTENATNDVMVLHQLWAEDNDVDYKFKFVLGASDDGYEVASPKHGHSKISGEKPSFTIADDYSNLSFYEGYYGVVKLMNGESKTKDITLTYDYEDNVAVFHFEYDANEAFHYRIEYWAVTPDMEDVQMLDAEPVGGGDTPEDQRKSEDGWNETENYAYSYTLHANVDKYKDKGLTLASAEWTTITLRSDVEQDPGEKEAYAHPSQNIIQIFYKPLDNVTFTYKAVTYNNMEQKNPLTNNGGKILTPQGGSETIDPYLDTAHSTAATHPGFKFAGWYATTGEPGSKVLGEPVDNSWVTTSGDESTLTVGKGDFFIYMQDAEYWAVFVYEDDPEKLPTITYDTRIYDGNGQLVNTDGHDANVKLKCGDGTADVTVSETLVNALATPKTVTVDSKLPYYPYKNWLNEEEQVITGQAESPFNAIPIKFEDGTPDGYYYYVTTKYTCVFDERQASQVTLTYKVADSDTAMGNVRLGYTGSSTAKTVSETAYPKLGNPAAGATSTNPKVYSAIASVTESRYVFDYWSWNDSEGNSHSSDQPTLPEYKEGGVYVTTTFTAHFKLGKVKITTVAGEHGTIAEGVLSAVEVDAGTNYAYDTDGTLYFYAPDDQDMDEPIGGLTQTPAPYLGYENATPPWKDYTTGTPQELTFQPIMSDMTFICSFIDKTGVTLTYKVQTGSNTGYIIESGDVRELQYHTQNITNPATCDAPATVTAYPRTADGYEFKYWTIDEEDTDDPESQYTDPEAPVTRDTEDGHSAYKSHTYYAHFGTYATTVTIDVYYSYAENNEIYDGSSYGTITLENVQTGTPYTYGATPGAGPQGTDQGWLTIGSTTGIAQNKHDLEVHTWNFASWQMETNQTTHTTQGLPGSGTTECKIMGETHFVAMFQETGEANYTINYYFQTVASAKTGDDFEEIVPETVTPESTGKWTNWESYPDVLHDDGVAGRYYPSVVGKAQAGTGVTIVYANPIGFNYGGINSDPTTVSGTTWTLSSTEGYSNVLNVFYMRQTQYPFVIDTYVETIKSARENRDPEDPHPVGTDGREYEFNYTLSIFGWDPGEEGTKLGPLQGIYGSEITIPLHVFEYEGTESWEVKYDHAPLKSGETDKFSYVIGSYGWGDPEYFVKIADTSSLLHERQKADSPNAGVLNLACNRNPYYSFKIEVYRELPDGTYPAAAEATITNTNCGVKHYDAMTRVSSEELVALKEDGRTLKDEYQVSTWDDIGPELTPSTTDTFKTWLSGYNYASCAPNNGKIIVSDWNNDPTLKLYYKRSNSISYTVNLHQETLASSQARFGTSNPPSEFTQSGTYTPDPADGRLGEQINLSFLKSYYDEEGFTVYDPGATPYISNFTITIVADETKNVANIYYTRQTNVSFQVQYFQQDLDGNYPTLPTDTKSYSGIYELVVYTDAIAGEHEHQPTGINPQEDFRVRSDYHGFTFDPTMSDPKPTATIGYGTVIKLYYSRNSNINWKVQFYTQGIIESTGQPDPNWANATLKGEEILTGKTGATVSFADYVNGNAGQSIPPAIERYDGFSSLDHVGVFNGTRETTVTTYQLVIDGQGRSLAKIYLKRDTDYEYQIWDYVQTVDEEGQPEDNYVLRQATYESMHGVFGATVTLTHKTLQGYTPKTGSEGKFPTTGEIVIGTKYKYGDVEDDKTIGRLFYDVVKVNYTIELQKETLQSAKDRRSESRQKADALYEAVYSTTRQAYTSQRIAIEPVKNELIARAEALGCEFYKTDPSLENASAQVNADGTTKITVYVLLSVNRTITANFYRESLAHAHDKSVTPVYDPNLDELNVTIDNLITGEDLVYADTPKLANRYEGFTIHESDPAGHLVINNDPGVSQSCSIGYWREINADWNYSVGYRVETKESAQARSKDPTLDPVYEVYTDTTYPNEWNVIGPGIYGDIINKDTKIAKSDRTPGEPLARTITGYIFNDCNPESITVDENLTAENRKIEFHYLRDPNVAYKVQVWQQDFDGTAPVTNSYHEYGGAINCKGIFETTVDDQTPDVQAIIANYEEDMVGYNYDHYLPVGGITITADNPTLNLYFNNDAKNKVVIYHYGENATSGQNRANTWTWDGDDWVVPEDEPAPVFDVALTDATETIQGTDDNPIWTGSKIQLAPHVISTEKGTQYYGYDGEHAVYESEYVVTGQNDSARIDYKRMVWTVTPDPKAIDPDDSRTYPSWDPDPIAVAHGNKASINPAEETYIIAIPVDDVYPTEDVTVPVNYREKVYRVTYLSNDTALGTVDPETEDCMILTGNMVGSNANAVGGAKFENWTNEAGEIVSTDINYVPEKYPVPDPELLTANANASSNGEVFAEATFTANFSAAEVTSQTGDVTGGLIAIASLCALAAAYVLFRRRNSNKVVGNHVK